MVDGGRSQTDDVYRVFLKILTYLFSVLRDLMYTKAHVRCT